jgi:glycosyltransferase involved in cell wall biosynthesis
MKLSVCLIVKNEEKYLARALDNLRDVVDEICVLDTGSIDGTLEIAERYGCKIQTGGDAMNKGEARTQSLKMATGDWCIVLDADETIESPEQMREVINSTDGDVLYIRLSFMNKENQPTLTYSQARIFRRGVAKYKYRAHEVPVWNKGVKVRWTSLVWEHRPPPERTGWKKLYTLQRLLLDVKEYPKEPRPLFYLGRQYYYMSQWQQAVDTFDRYIALSEEEPNIDLADGHYYQGICYRKLKQDERAIKAFYMAASMNPKKREYWQALSDAYKDIGDNTLAFACMRFVEHLDPPSWGYKHEHLYGADYYDKLALSAYKAGTFSEAMRAGVQAVKLNPDKRLMENLKYYIKAVNYER